MIPVHDLLHLLESLLDADYLRANPGVLRDGRSFLNGPEELDAQDFATLARVAAGEAWESAWVSSS